MTTVKNILAGSCVRKAKICDHCGLWKYYIKMKTPITEDSFNEHHRVEKLKNGKLKYSWHGLKCVKDWDKSSGSF